jgi:ADP-ribose pyrophosphatase YjhB (NUDIX family)
VMPPQDIESQVEALSREYGPPLRCSVRLGSLALWQKRARLAEVCMVIRRSNGNLLTFRKTFYPPGIYRLLTGGVDRGEMAIHALHREVAEETGLNVHVARFLAAVKYCAEDGDAKYPVAFSCAFLLDEIGGVLACHDPDEELESFSEIQPEQLPMLVEQLENLPDSYSRHFNESWRDWGLYRAAAHRAVAQALAAHTPTT